MFNHEYLLGKSFAYGARGPDFYDCWGLCLEVRRAIGKSVPEFYSCYEVDKISLNSLINQEKPNFIKLSSPTPFCFVTFIIKPPFTTHIGIVLEDCRSFIHIMRACSVAVEKLRGMEWKHRITGFWEYDYNART